MRSSTRKKILSQIPGNFDSMNFLRLVHSGVVNAQYLKLLKQMSLMTDSEIADCLHLNVKTYRRYRDSGVALRKDIQEHVVVLLSLIKHGIEVFGDSENFKKWLSTGNFYLNNEKPIAYLDTLSGIKFLDDRLIAMEYGDNV